MAFTATNIRAARRHLRKNDPVMRSMISQVGKFTLRCERNRFWMLVRSIISQQISVGAARAIRGRLEEKVAPDSVTPESLLQLNLRQLRSVGLSSQKASYVRDLASKTDQGLVQLQTIGRRSDAAIIEELTQVKGIGHWTAQMFLIFALGRLDVFPIDDLGIRMAIRDRYGLAELPDKQVGNKIAQPWHPYASVASWYCWRSLDQARQRTTSAKKNPA